MNVRYEQQGNYLIPCIRTKGTERNTFRRMGKPPQTVSKAEPQGAILQSSDKRKAL